MLSMRRFFFFFLMIRRPPRSTLFSLHDALPISNDEFNGDNFDHSGLGFIGGGFLQAATSGSRPVGVPPGARGTPRRGPGGERAGAAHLHPPLPVPLPGARHSHRRQYPHLDPTYPDAHGLPLPP